MNKEIIIGFLNEHDTNCTHCSVSNFIKTDDSCALCNSMNRDISLLITNIHGARRTVDVGLALPPSAELTPYEPYKSAGFEVFVQEGKTETERIKSIFNATIMKGYETVIVLSSNVPNLPLSYIEYALYDLRNGNNLVLGPSENGMFYLIGIKRMLYDKIINDDIFSTISFDNRTLRDSTLKMMQEHCNDCSILPNWYILKSMDDLKKLYKDSLHGIGWKAQWTHLIAHDLLG